MKSLYFKAGITKTVCTTQITK